MLSFISKIFGSKSDRDLKDIRPLVDEIHAATSKIQSLSNDQLRQKTIEFKRKIKENTLDEENKILSLKEKAELAETDLAEKESIYADIDKIKKEVKEKSGKKTKKTRKKLDSK
jgi:preprotein translocase subunit SecA